MLRVAKYPAQSKVNKEDAIGCGAHMDFVVVSIIWQMDVGSLEIATQDSRWFHEPVIPGTFICPIGDVMSNQLRSKLFLMFIGSIVCVISLLGLMPGVTHDVNFYYVIVFVIGFATGSQVLAYALMVDLHHRVLQGKATSIVSLFSVGFGAMIQMVCGYIPIYHVASLLILCAATAIALAIFLNLRRNQFQHSSVQVRV